MTNTNSLGTQLVTIIPWLYSLSKPEISNWLRDIYNTLDDRAVI